jgi:hypothetical protein
MNKTTKAALYAMKKDELVEFAWKMVKAYNVSQEERDYQRRLLDFALVKSGDTSAEQVA